MQCTVCGTVYLENSAFCAKCGNNLLLVQPQTPPKTKSSSALIIIVIVCAVFIGLFIVGSILAAIFIPLMASFTNNARIANADATASSSHSVITQWLQSEALTRNRGMQPGASEVIIITPREVVGVNPSNWSVSYDSKGQIETRIKEVFEESFYDTDGTFLLILHNNECIQAAYFPNYNGSDVSGFVGYDRNGLPTLQNIQDGRATANIGGVRARDIVGTYPFSSW